MTLYRHAIWGPCTAWPTGYVYGAPVEQFKRSFPGKVREMGLPLLVWESDPAFLSEPS